MKRVKRELAGGIKDYKTKAYIITGINIFNG
jgi:hypothetical protein